MTKAKPTQPNSAQAPLEAPAWIPQGESNETSNSTPPWNTQTASPAEQDGQGQSSELHEATVPLAPITPATSQGNVNTDPVEEQNLNFDPRALSEQLAAQNREKRETMPLSKKVNLFAEQAPSKNIFAPDPKPKSAVNEIPVYEVPEGTPSWSDFARFCMKYGDKIEQARYPNPSGPIVETVWKGIRVINYPVCQLQHKKFGWVDWVDVQENE